MYLAVFQSLLPKLGFAWTVRVLAFIALVIFAISIPVLLFNTPGKQRSRSTRNLVDIDAVKDGPFVLYGLSSFCIFLGYLVPFFFIPSFAQIVLGTSRSLSFWALAISSAASILGRLGAALAAQKFDIMLPWTASAAISGALCLYWIRISTVATFFAFCGLYGTLRKSLTSLSALTLCRGYIRRACCTATQHLPQNMQEPKPSWNVDGNGLVVFRYSVSHRQSYCWSAYQCWKQW